MESNMEKLNRLFNAIKGTPEYIQFMLGGPSWIFDPTTTEDDERWETDETKALIEELEEIADWYSNPNNNHAEVINPN